jgi:DNA processing protein
MLTLKSRDLPTRIQHIAQPPSQLYVEGDLLSLLERPCVGIVGSRKLTNYGRQVTERLARELALQGVIVISGLALGVDSIAHQAALDGGGATIAVLPGSVEEVYPSSHRQLALDILAKGGAVVSEYPKGTATLRHNFIARNQIIAGLSDVLLVTEAALKSGSLHTARFALEQGKEVLAVPGNITSMTSEGTNNLIKAGAVPVTSVDDVLRALKLNPAAAKQTVKGETEAEQLLIDLIRRGVSDGHELQLQSRLDIVLYNQSLTMLEIQGKIHPTGANHWSL